jgi:hypothetical protein
VSWVVKQLGDVEVVVGYHLLTFNVSELDVFYYCNPKLQSHKDGLL